VGDALIHSYLLSHTEHGRHTAILIMTVVELLEGGNYPDIKPFALMRMCKDFIVLVRMSLLVLVFFPTPVLTLFFFITINRVRMWGQSC
jgi:hypothetical protein